MFFTKTGICQLKKVKLAMIIKELNNVIKIKTPANQLLTRVLRRDGDSNPGDSYPSTD